MEQYKPLNSEDYCDPRGSRMWNTEIFCGRSAGVRGEARGKLPMEWARKTYLESTNEYEAAMKFVTSWEHWRAIAASKRMGKHIALWRDEKEQLDKAAAKKLLWKSAEKGNVTAQKALYEYRQQEIRKAAKEEKLSKAQQKALEAEERQNEMLQDRLNIIDFPSDQSKA